MTFFKRVTPKLNMSEATRLTRAGRLTEATTAIQWQLSGKPTLPENADHGAGMLPRVIESVAKPDMLRSRQGLAQTLRMIAAGRMSPRTPTEETDKRLPDGATFTTRSYHGPQGSRDYMLFVPASANAGPMPLIVMLHGCTQTPADFARGTRMNKLAGLEDCIVAYPAQTTAANMSKCWNWFRPADQARDNGEPAILAGIARAVLATENADPARVYVAGLSAGGAAAVIVAQAYPDLFAAVGVQSGLPVGAASDMPSAFAAMRTGATGWQLSHAAPTIVFHGTSDQTVAAGNGHAVNQQARRTFAGTTIDDMGQSAGGRHYARQILQVDGTSMCEFWLVQGAPHAWFGGDPAGSYTDPAGPDASAEMLRFFRQHRLP